MALVSSLAIGIAGATGAFSVVSRTPLVTSFLGPEQLVWFMVEDRNLRVRTLPPTEIFEAWREQLECCDRIEAFKVTEGAIRTGSGARPVTIAFVSSGLFEVVGTSPEVGRFFDPSEYETDSDLAIIGGGLARSVFGGKRRALGSTITVDGRSLKVVGVVPADYGYRVSPDERFDVLRPLKLEPREKVRVLGRIRENVSFDQAQAELETWGALHRREARQQEDVHWVLLRPGDTVGTTTLRMLQIVLLSGILLVLVTGSNIAHFMAAEAEAQKQEVAVRWALGANRMGLLRWKSAQVFGLTVTAGVVAAALASGGLKVATSLLPEDLRFLETAQVDRRGLLLAVILSFIVILCAGTAPLLSRRSERLKADLGGVRFGRGPKPGLGRAVGQIHVVTMVALSLALAVACLLVARTSLHLSHMDVGFETEGLQAVDVTLPATKYRIQEERRTFFRSLVERLSLVQGIESLALASPGPLGIGMYFGEIHFGGEQGTAATATGIGAAHVGLGYFRTLRQKVVAGREFIEEELKLGLDVIVISETTAKQFGPRPSDALGKYIVFEDNRRRILGVVADVHSPGAPQPFGTSQAYWPLRDYDTSMTMVLRASGELVPMVREITTDLDPDVIVEALPMNVRLHRSQAGVRFLATVLSLLASLALGLAVLGVYGVLTNFVAGQRKQTALRMALGANRGEVLRWIFFKDFSLCLLGAGIGILISFPLSATFADQLQGVEADNIRDRLIATALIVAATAVATWLPVRDAMRIEPAEILKES